MSIARRFAAPMLAFACLTASTLAQAFIDPPWISPAAPIAGEAISVNIHAGVCDAIAGREGFPQITQDGNAIRIVIFGFHYEEGDELCVFPTGTATDAVGSFQSGDYTLTIDMAYLDPLYGPMILNIGVISFTVAPSGSAVSVPTGSVAILILLILCLAFAARRNLAAMLLPMSLFFATSSSHAQSPPQPSNPPSAWTCPSDAPGAPTATQIVNWVNSSPRSSPPPLQAFTVKSPTSGDFLIPDRATGDFLSWLNANTHSARYKLEQCTILTFASPSDLATGVAALRSDPYVAAASAAVDDQFMSATLTHFDVGVEPLAGEDQYGWFDLNTDAAWMLTGGGYALVGVIDTGLAVDHPALRQFDGINYVGGNFIKAASKDVGLTGLAAQSLFDPTDVDEAKAMYISDSACVTSPGYYPPDIAGHGTHTAGLLAANGASGLGVQGTCKHCGIAEWKAAYLTCIQSGAEIQPALNPHAQHRAKAQAVDMGVQALSMSFGAPNPAGVYSCVANRNLPPCLTIAHSMGRDVAMVASSGNKRQEIAFPASDKRVISAGGFSSDLSFWNDAGHCRAVPWSSECGSNFSVLNSGTYLTRQELLGSAKRVLSTIYKNMTWVDYAECGDSYGTPAGDGIGWCTGTSMSTPQIVGAVGLLRSINPLVPIGDPDVASPVGLRRVLAQTASRHGAWDSHYGYGIPDIAEAARTTLGKAAGVNVRNRVTPLFRLFSAFSSDFAETTSPQYALALMISQVHKYTQPVTGLGAQPTITGYTEFPYDHHDQSDAHDTYESAPAAPLAGIYVMTTDKRPRDEWPALIPLYLMDKPRANGTDYMLVTTTAEIQSANTAGYRLRTIQGYIYQPCTPEDTCIPPGAQRIWREYKSTTSDCAVFLHSEKPTFEANSYSPTAHCPGGGASNMIGYAYPATDSDSDGLPDGFEYVVGTNHLAADSDGDRIGDATEMPLAGIEVGDPCFGGTLGASNCAADIIFKHGFEAI